MKKVRSLLCVAGSGVAAYVGASGHDDQGAERAGTTVGHIRVPSAAGVIDLVVRATSQPSR